MPNTHDDGAEGSEITARTFRFVFRHDRTYAEPDSLKPKRSSTTAGKDRLFPITIDLFAFNEPSVQPSFDMSRERNVSGTDVVVVGKTCRYNFAILVITGHERFNSYKHALFVQIFFHSTLNVNKCNVNTRWRFKIFCLMTAPYDFLNGVCTFM